MRKPIFYVNYRGEESIREVTPCYVWHGSSEWHSEPQWFLHAYDHDKADFRDFALNDIKDYDGVLIASEGK